MSARWTGALAITAGGALWVGRAFDTGRHAHHAHQICLGLESELALRGASGPWRRWRAAVVAPDTAHELDAGGRAVALLFVEPESHAGRALARIYGGRGIRSLDASTTTRLRALARAGGAGLEDTLRFLGGTQPLAALDPRVERALEMLRGARVDYPSSAVVARSVASSVGRFRHLFRAQVGLSYRTYLVWLRLGVAIEAAAAGSSLTAAAHAAGFADSAHLSRTFRRMFGLMPSALAR